MCGRFTLTRSAAEVAAHFGLDTSPASPPRFNVAPTQRVLAVRSNEDGVREAAELVWGLVPHGAKQASDAAKRINARVETLARLPAFRDAAAQRRCLVPADGFYEWRGARGRREPFHAALAQGELFAMAGVWERWRDPSGVALESVAIVTTPATPNVAAIHDRMPLIVDPEGYRAWLDPHEHDVAAVLKRLPTTRGARLALRRVSTRVNDVRHDDAQCLASAEQGALF
jgi:putative SOS response-associated peptidase YedK